MYIYTHTHTYIYMYISKSLWNNAKIDHILGHKTPFSKLNNLTHKLCVFLPQWKQIRN